MPNQFAAGKYAIAQCDRCNFRFKLKQLKSLVIKTKNVNILVCPECWEPDQPQLQLGMYPVGGSRSFDVALTPNDLIAPGLVNSVTVS